MKFSMSLFTMALSTMSGAAFRTAGGARGVASLAFVRPAVVAGASSSSHGSGSMSPRAKATSMSMSSSASTVEGMIQSEIDSNKVMVFSKSYCPHCAATKSLFADLGVEFKVIELDQIDNGSDIQSTLAQMTGQRTVPNTFVNGQHLGGNDKAQAAAQSGELQKMLNL